MRSHGAHLLRLGPEYSVCLVIVILLRHDSPNGILLEPTASVFSEDSIYNHVQCSDEGGGIAVKETLLDPSQS